jgi:flagellar hook-associated protein 1 FlgK
MADMMQVGLSGIRSSQASLTTTGHNIANINTKGYSRQNVEVESAEGHRYGRNFIGQGAVISSIERVYDQFAFTDNINNTSQLGYAKEVYQQNSQLDSVLSNEDTSITKPVLAVFESVNSIADHPNMLESRQVFLESAVNMVNQYHRIYDNLSVQHAGINSDINNTAKTITTLADNIASLNEQISAQVLNGTESTANDLMDKRGQKITELSQLVDVSAVDVGRGMVNVYIGSGQSIVMKNKAVNIVAVNSTENPRNKELAIKVNDHFVKLDGSRLGGKVSAMYDTRDHDIEPAFNQLGQNIIGLTHSINEQQKQGQTLDGKIGEALFNDVNSVVSMRNRVLSHNDGLGTAQLSVRIDDLSKLTPDNYELVVNDYIAGPPETIGFNITNQTTGQTQVLGPVDLSKTRRIDVPDSGLSIGLDSLVGSDPLREGKTFTLRPTRSAAQEVNLQHQDASKIAAADAEIKALPNEGNQGKAIVRVSEINNKNDPLYMDQDNPLQIVVTDNSEGVLTYDIIDKNGYPVVLPPGSENKFQRAVPPGSEGSVSPDFSVGEPLTGLTLKTDLLTGKANISIAGIELEVSGQAAVGDQFSLNYNETGRGDNRNIMKMAHLQTQKVMNNNKATFQDIYSGMLSEIGAKTANADVSMQSAEVLQKQSFERIQSNSGVNMDEEAANMLKFQQHYGAAARVISIASELFDTILQASRT